jgi:fibronectin-binding autotransporter adhesin
MKPKSTLRSFLALAGTSLLAFSYTHAGQIWDGGGTDDNWNTPANWDSDALPDFATAITFAGDTRNAPVNNLTADTTIGGINFSNDGTVGFANAFALSGARITLGGNITTTASSPAITDTSSLNMILNGNRTITTGADHHLSISGVISQTGGNQQLIKEGAGVLTLSGLNTYLGGTTLNNGTIRVGATVGTSSTNGILGGVFNSGITMANSATAVFDVNGFTAYIKDLKGGGALGGNVTLGSGTLYIVNPSGSNSYDGVISGTGNLQVDGSSGWNTAGAHTYSGVTTIGPGNTSIATSILANGGVASGIGQSSNDESNLIFRGGTLRYTGAAVASTDRRFTLAGNGALGVGAAGFITWTSANPVTYSGTGTRTLFFNGNGAGTGTFAGSIGNNGSDAVTVTKSGTSTWALTGTSSYSGGTNIQTGALAVGRNNGGVGGDSISPDGTSTSLGGGAIIVTAGAALHINTAGLNIANNITLNGLSYGVNSGGPTATNSGPWNGAIMGASKTGVVSNTFSGTITLNATSNVSTNWNDKTMIITGKVTGVGGLVIDNSAPSSRRGSLIRLDNTTNDYEGDTAVNAGNGLGVQPTLILGASNVIPDGAGKGNLNVLGNFNLNGFSETVNGLSGSGVINSGVAGACTLTIGNNNATGLTYSGSIQNGSGTVALTKIGSGNQTLSGSNTFTGNTTVSAGTLTFSGSGALSSSAAIVSVASGAQVIASGSVDNVLGFGATRTWDIAGTFNSTSGFAQTMPATVNLNNGTLSGVANGTFGTYLGNTGYDVTITANGTTNTINAANFGLGTNVDIILNTPLVADALSVSSPLGLAAQAGTVTKSGLGTATLSGVNNYTGTTAINGGTLVITGATQATSAITFGGGKLGLDIASSVTAASASVNFTGQQVLVTGAPTLASYTLLTANSITGTPTLASPAPSGYALQVFGGNELRLVQTGTTYASWIAGFPGVGLLNGPTDDPDRDGIDNAAEMVLGGNPATGMDAALLPTIELVTNPVSIPAIPAGNYFLFTYRRTAVSEAALVAASCETDTDLVAPWATAVDGVSGVVIHEDMNFSFTPAAPANTDRVRVYVPRGVNTKLFGRLKTVVP